MKTLFRLLWLKPGKAPSRPFRLEGAGELYSQYTERIAKFTAVSTEGNYTSGIRPTGPTKLWLCDRGPKARVLSSEDLADRLQKLLDVGSFQLEIAIGGPDGLSPESQAALRPDLLWSFGSLTLPHELAAVVAAEQLYRAWTIVKNHPYHLGH